MIVGAGPAGTATALALLQARPDLKVLLADEQTFPRDKSCGDAISPASVRALQALDATEVVSGYAPNSGFLMRGPSGGVAAADGLVRDGSLIAGYTIPRLDFDDRLLRLAQTRGAHVLTPARFVASNIVGGTRELQFAGTGAPVQARLLIGADGANSRVRRDLGLSVQPDKMTAVASRAYVERGSASLGLGPIEFFFQRELLPAYAWHFPIDQSRSNIGVAVPVLALRKRGLRLNDLLKDFAAWLESDGGYVLTGPPRQRRGHLLPHAPHMPQLDASARATVIGDAASMINAFSGEGISYSFAAGQMLALALEDTDFADSASVRSGLAMYSRRFHDRYAAHLRSGYWAQRLAAAPVAVDLVVRAAKSGDPMLNQMYDLLFGEGRIDPRFAGHFVRALA